MVNAEKFTVLIPTYNRIAYLTKILDSIPIGIQIIVGDNGAYLPEEFKTKYPEVRFDSRPVVLDPLANWNKCIEAVKTPWFIIPSDDDLYPPGAFDLLDTAISEYQDADLICFGHTFIDEHDNIMSVWEPEKKMIFDPPFGYTYFQHGVLTKCVSMLYRTSKAFECGLFDNSFKITAGDSKFIQKFLLSGKTVFLPETLGYYRIWPNSSTTLTISSDGWLEEIDRWQNDIATEAQQAFGRIGKKIDSRAIKDEVYGINMLQGIIGFIKNNKRKEIWPYIKRNRFPWHASWKTKLRILNKLVGN